MHRVLSKCWGTFQRIYLDKHPSLKMHWRLDRSATEAKKHVPIQHKKQLKNEKMHRALTRSLNPTYFRNLFDEKPGTSPNVHLSQHTFFHGAIEGGAFKRHLPVQNCKRIRTSCVQAFAVINERAQEEGRSTNHQTKQFEKVTTPCMALM